MKALESPQTPMTAVNKVTHRNSQYMKVRDGRKQPIRGLWVRGGRYYARLNVQNPLNGKVKTRRIPLTDSDGKPVKTVAQAVAELRRLQTQKLDNSLPVLERTSKFNDYAQRYLNLISSGQGAKKPGTVDKEKGILARWIREIGELRLDQIKRLHVNRFVEKRLSANKSPRTINLDIITFRVVMKRAHSDGLIQRLPTEGLKQLKTITTKRSLFSTADLDALCKAAFETKQDKVATTVPLTANAQQFVDYVRLMSYCGARRNEALGIKWEDVDFEKGQLWIKRQITRFGIIQVKNSEQRVVEFNPSLRAYLIEMHTRRAPDSVWLFPSSQRGKKDIAAKTFRESLLIVRARAKKAHFGFHDCRHHFMSMCVMSGIDYMTIAEWVGHKDGGILIGRVYGHLANSHKKLMGEKVMFQPIVVKVASAVVR